MGRLRVNLERRDEVPTTVELCIKPITMRRWYHGPPFGRLWVGPWVTRESGMDQQCVSYVSQIDLRCVAHVSPTQFARKH